MKIHRTSLARPVAVALAAAALAGTAGTAGAADPAPTARHLTEAVRAGRSGHLATDVHSDAAAKKSRGYVLLFGKPTSLPSGGLTYVVAPKAPHRTMLATVTKAAVKAQQAAGLDVRYGGYGTSTTRGKAVVVSENQAGCGGNVLASTGVGVLDYGSYVVVDRSTVHVCTALLHRSAATKRAALFHEFGHAVGLGHFDGAVSNRRQIMNSAVQPQNGSYQNGDTHGLDTVAAKSSASQR